MPVLKRVSRARARNNKFRRKEMRTVKYSRGMRKSWDDNAGCQPPARRPSVRLRAEHLSDENDAADARLAEGLKFELREGRG